MPRIQIPPFLPVAVMGRFMEIDAEEEERQAAAEDDIIAAHDANPPPIPPTLALPAVPKEILPPPTKWFSKQTAKIGKRMFPKALHEAKRKGGAGVLEAVAVW